MLKSLFSAESLKIKPEWVNAVQDEIINAIKYADKDATFDGSDNQQLLKAIQKVVYWGGAPISFDLKNDSQIVISDLNLDPKKHSSVSFFAHGVAKDSHGTLVRVTLNFVAYSPYSKCWTGHSYEFSLGDRLYYLNVNEAGELVFDVPDICSKLEGKITLSQIKYVGV